MLIKPYLLRLWIVSKLVAGYWLLPELAWGQVLPDGSTPTPNPGSCAPVCTITGGTTDSTGRNLFHSFDEFSVPEGGEAFFANDASIINIVNRVTGKLPSEIYGLISANDTANVFLLNPNGIVFGPFGSLNIGGSFVATTADAIQFEDQGVFSASNTNGNPELLTVNPSAFLFNQIETQPIINQAVFTNQAGLDGLEVPEGKSLLLVGGDISLESFIPGLPVGGRILAPGGRIELGGIKGAGVIELNINGDNLSLSYENDAVLADVSLTDEAELNVSNGRGGRSGDIEINARSILVENNSFITSTSESQEDAGSIVIRADNSVTVDDGGISSETSVEGKGGDIEIETRLLYLDNSGFILTSTEGEGNAGRIFLEVDAVFLNNLSSIASDAESRSKFVGNVGNVGQILIQTGTLSLTQSSKISTLTSGDTVNVGSGESLIITVQDTISLASGSSISSETQGQGNASNIQIDAAELVVQDQALISAETSATGNGGEINITVERLTLGGGGQISAAATPKAAPSAQSGNVIINANQINLSGEATGLLAETQGPATAGSIALNSHPNSSTLTVTFQEGAVISSSTSGSGAGGTVTATAPEAITLSGDGRLSAQTTGSGAAGNVFIQTDQLTVQENAVISAEATGEGGIAGSVDINAQQLTVESGADVTVSSPQGEAGNLTVTADIILLDNGGLNAEAGAGQGAAIALQDLALLLMRNGGQISAEAFRDANGGNILINAPDGFIVAIADQDNDIIAKAFEGQGGNIDIIVRNIFGLVERPAIANNGTNDIDASSEFGLDGNVIIQSPDVEPDQGIVELAGGLAVPAPRQSCQANSGASSQFFNIGRGGLSQSPDQPLTGEHFLDDIYPAASTFASNPSAPDRNASSVSSGQIVEARGWVVNARGEVVLVADVSEGAGRGGCYLSGR